MLSAKASGHKIELEFITYLLYNELCSQQVNTKAEDITALHAASVQGHQQVVAELLNAGAKSDIVDNEGLTPIFYAVSG